MTQAYTPDTDDVINLIVAGMGRVTQLGLAPVGYPRTETDAVEAAKRWLAAHDAQIRAEALEEGRIAEHDEAYGWGDAINPYRKEQKQLVSQQMKSEVPRNRIDRRQARSNMRQL